MTPEVPSLQKKKTIDSDSNRNIHCLCIVGNKLSVNNIELSVIKGLT